MIPLVVRGTLSNGLSYYIRHNEEPRDRAQIALVVKAGSVHEEEDQQGLAHFVEHMGFNGTERFAKQEIVEYLESIGNIFGPDVNAQTGFEDTTYWLEIPTDDPEIAETAFRILSDWAYGISFDPEEVDLESSVVLEEWRLSSGIRVPASGQSAPTAIRFLPLRQPESHWPPGGRGECDSRATEGVLRALVPP